MPIPSAKQAHSESKVSIRPGDPIGVAYIDDLRRHAGLVRNDLGRWPSTVFRAMDRLLIMSLLPVGDERRKHQFVLSSLGSVKYADIMARNILAKTISPITRDSSLLFVALVAVWDELQPDGSGRLQGIQRTYHDEHGKERTFRLDTPTGYLGAMLRRDGFGPRARKFAENVLAGAVSKDDVRERALKALMTLRAPAPPVGPTYDPSSCADGCPGCKPLRGDKEILPEFERLTAKTGRTTMFGWIKAGKAESIPSPIISSRPRTVRACRLKEWVDRHTKSPTR